MTSLFFKTVMTRTQDFPGKYEKHASDLVVQLLRLDA